MKKQKIQIGHCKTPHGIRGEFSFILYNSEDSVLHDGAEVTLIPYSADSSLPIGGKDFKVTKIKFGNKTIVSLEGVDDRNTVESMVPFDIYFAREDFPETEPDEYYLNDLLGLEVFDYISKNELGRVIDFYENGVQIVLKIKTKTEIIDLLFIEQFVPIVDLELNRMEVIIPGFFE